jgi:hypothetical protein
MALLLSKSEADCLVPQHKQILDISNLRRSQLTDAGRSPLPRERFSPLAGFSPIGTGRKSPGSGHSRKDERARAKRYN